MQRAYWLVPLLAIGAMALNIVVSIAVVAVYSIIIAPGQPFAAYEAFAQQSAPVSSVVAGMPILFAAGWLAARHGGGRPVVTATAVALVYVAIDGLLLVIAQAGGDIWLWEGLSWATKLAAAALGGYVAKRL